MTPEQFYKILPMYIGHKFTAVTRNGHHMHEDFTAYDMYSFSTGHLEQFKLFLRPISDMTEEEEAYYDSKKITLFSIEPFKDQVMTEAHLTLYLSQRGIDLFGLIEEGYAIDKTKLENETGKK